MADVLADVFSDRVLQLHNLCAGRIHRRTSFVRVFGVR
jgi:hypothetical protein